MTNKILLGLFVSFSFSTIVLGQNLETQIAEIDQSIQKHLDAVEVLKNQKEELKLSLVRKQLKEKGLPALKTGEELIEHKAMYLVYDESHEQAKWVAHVLSVEIMNGKEGRSNDFRPDPLIKTGSAVEADYFLKRLVGEKTEYDGFGYDRGHLAPSADFRWSAAALSESYFYSNMSPQLPEFNREGWARLEDMIRGYIYEHQTDLFIVTGPVLTPNLPKIERGVNKVSIPKYFYKVAYDAKNQRGIAFLVPHQAMKNPTESYAISIDSLEAFTGIDFFASLPTVLQANFEKAFELSHWMPLKAKNDVVPLTNLGKNRINTLDARDFMNTKNKVTVCGTVVSTHQSKKGNVYLNLDKAFPNTIFSVTIWESDLPNFVKDPLKYNEKCICVKGEIQDYKGVPTMYISNENQIELYKP